MIHPHAHHSDHSTVTEQHRHGASGRCCGRHQASALLSRPSASNPVANYPRCPVCGSYEVSRHTEMGRVWFSCRRCGITF